LAETFGGTRTICKGEFREGGKEVGHGLRLTLDGLGAWVDLPLSIAGDILTLPVAYARQKQYPWATSWGDKPKQLSPTPQTETPLAELDPKIPDVMQK
jgi:hypothetical protein